MTNKHLPLAEPLFDEEEIALVRQCLASKWVTQGPLVEQFEQLVAAYQGVEFARATTSCTAALHLAMLALDIGPGDEVIVPAFTWVTSASCIEYVGARPVFVDVSADTFNIDADAIAERMTQRTKAIVAVHLFGAAAPMDEILALAKPRGIHVIEDAACAIGTSYRDRRVGAIGDIGCFSFHPRKVITTGEGGMVTINSEELAERVGSYRNHGATGIVVPDGEVPGPWTMATFERCGYNLRMSDIQAAIGVAQMKKLPALLAERNGLAQHYHELLAPIDKIAIPSNPELRGHTYQSYVIRLLEGDASIRNRVMSCLQDCGISTRPGTHAVHRLGYYRRKYDLKLEEFPVAAACEDSTITLPLFPRMTQPDQQRVAETLAQALAQYA